MTHAFHTLIDVFAHNAEVHGDRSAVILGDAAWSHATLYRAVREQAGALAAMGIRQGDRVLLVAGNRPEVIVLLGAVAWLGAILVPLNLRLSPAETAQQARDAAPSVAIVDSACDNLWQAAWPEGMPGVPTVALAAPVGASLVCAGLASTGAVAEPRHDAPDAGVIMLHTAAVAGHARGALLAQSNLTASAWQIARVWSLNENDRWLGVLPLFHAGGIGLAVTLLGVGGACVLQPRFDAAASVMAIERDGITVCATFAPMLGALLDAAAASGATLRSLRICVGLEPPAVLERLAAMCPAANFWSAYGQAEVSSMVCLGLQRERPGAAGRAVAPSQVGVLDARGEPVAANVEGEIAVRGPTVFLGYWDLEKQRAVKPASSWHHTGDLGHIDEDGWLWFTGRTAHKQLIKTGGENVYPREVELVLLEHPAVAEAFVFGKADEQWGEAVHAVCALKPGHQTSADELSDFVGQQLARYKRPRSIRFLRGPLDRSGPC